MGIFSLSSKSGEASLNLPHHSGVPGFPDGWACELTLHDNTEQLEIRPRIKTKAITDSVYLPYAKISGVLLATEKEIQEKGKSVLGRAMVGGVLLGPVGAIVGGLSGQGKKVKATTRMFFIINYKPDPNSDDVKVLTFINNTMMNAGKFVNLVKERAGSLPEEHVGPVTL